MSIDGHFGPVSCKNYLKFGGVATAQDRGLRRWHICTVFIISTAYLNKYGPVEPETQDNADRKAKLQPTSKTVTLSTLSFFIYSLRPSVSQNAGLASKKITNIFHASLFRVIFNLQINKLK